MRRLGSVAIACWFSFSLLAAVPPAAAATGSEGLERCLGRLPRGERAACFEEALSRPRPVREIVQALAPLVVEEPATALSVARKVASRPGLPREEVAFLKDIEGQALAELGRKEEAAAAFEAALDLDDGLTKLVWTPAFGREPSWTAALDAGAGRLERAARAFLEAGRADRARPLLERALELGATGERLPGPIDGSPPVPPSGHVEPVFVEPEFPKLPALEVDMLEGGPRPVVPVQGRALLLEFWASWCPPCMASLPKLQALYESERNNGLTVVAVNADEPDDAIRKVVRRLGLTMPIARYGPALESAFRVRALPTTILVDGQGRLRARWDGYQSGQEALVAAKARRLLGEDAEGRPRKVAELFCRGLVGKTLWARQLSDAVLGIAAVRGSAGLEVAVSSGSAVLLFDARGNEVRRIPARGGRLVALEPRSAAEPALAVFHTGGTEVGFLVLGTEQGSVTTFRAPAPVLDAVALPSQDSAGGPKLALGTTRGVYLLDGAALTTAWAAEREALAVAVEPSESQPHLLAVDGRGKLFRLDRNGRRLGETEVGPATARLLASARPDSGFGLAPSNLSAWATGNFQGESGFEIAAGTVAGQLVLLDGKTGRELLRATWPGISSLASGDLDGDGVEELIVASDRYLVALRLERCGPPAGGPSPVAGGLPSAPGS